MDCIQGQCPAEFKDKWAWPETRADKVVTEDGSRGGRPGMVLAEEFQRERP